MRRDGSFNFIYAVPAVLKLRDSEVPLDSNAASYWYGKYVEQRDIADEWFDQARQLKSDIAGIMAQVVAIVDATAGTKRPPQ